MVYECAVCNATQEFKQGEGESDYEFSLRRPPYLVCARKNCRGWLIPQKVKPFEFPLTLNANFEQPIGRIEITDPEIIAFLKEGMTFLVGATLVSRADGTKVVGMSFYVQPATPLYPTDASYDKAVRAMKGYQADHPLDDEPVQTKHQQLNQIKETDAEGL